MAIQTVKTGVAVNDGTGDDARTAFTKINQNFTDSTHAASREVGTGAGNVMEVGAFGIGNPPLVVGTPSGSFLRGGQFFSYMQSSGDDTSAAPEFQMGVNIPWLDVSHAAQILVGLKGTNKLGIRWWDNSTNKFTNYMKIFHQGNTSVDSNGFIKAASPIVRLFADRIELNGEAKLQDITFEKLGVGDYLVKGSLGFAQEGWYIEMPKDANGNVLVAVIYEQLDNNDISVKTYAKKFDEETGDIVANTSRPRDIPATRWIDLRLQALPQTNPQPFNTDETVATNAE